MSELKMIDLAASPSTREGLKWILRAQLFATTYTLIAAAIGKSGWVPDDGKLQRKVTKYSLCQYYDDPPMTYIVSICQPLMIIFALFSFMSFMKGEPWIHATNLFEKFRMVFVGIYFLGVYFYTWSMSISPFDGGGKNDEFVHANFVIHLLGYACLNFGLISLYLFVLIPILWSSTTRSGNHQKVKKGGILLATAVLVTISAIWIWNWLGLIHTASQSFAEIKKIYDGGNPIPKWILSMCKLCELCVALMCPLNVAFVMYCLPQEKKEIETAEAYNSGTRVSKPAGEQQAMITSNGLTV